MSVELLNKCYELDIALKEKQRLQSNWNSLREWLENNPNVALYGDGKDFITYIELQKVLDKMNELEGDNND